MGTTDPSDPRNPDELDHEVELSALVAIRLPDRLRLLRAARRRALAERRVAPDGNDLPPEPSDPAALDTIVSAWKIEGRPPPPEAAATVGAFAALMAIRGQIDFDDLVVGAVAALEADPRLRHRWQARFSHLCVASASMLGGLPVSAGSSGDRRYSKRRSEARR